MTITHPTHEVRIDNIRVTIWNQPDTHPPQQCIVIETIKKGPDGRKQTSHCLNPNALTKVLLALRRIHTCITHPSTEATTPSISSSPALRNIP